MSDPYARLDTKKGDDMSVIIIPQSIMDDFDGDLKVCVFCDTATVLPVCVGCEEYKGLMTVEEWEDYTGEVWEA